MVPPASTLSAKAVASVVARRERTIRDKIAANDGCTAFECGYAANRINRYIGISDEIGNLGLELAALGNKADEIRPLLVSTLFAVQKVNNTRNATSGCLTNSGGQLAPCTEQTRAWEQSFRAFLPELDAWRP